MKPTYLQLAYDGNFVARPDEHMEYFTYGGKLWYADPIYGIVNEAAGRWFLFGM